MKRLLFPFVLMMSLAASAVEPTRAPVQIAIIGLVHDHVRGFLPELLQRTDVQLAGIIEPDAELSREIAARYGLQPASFHPTLESLLAARKVDVAALFTSTAEHRRWVEACAPRGIHVMMEKPMAVSFAEARAMADAASRGGVELVVNYETTWYPSNHAAYAAVHDNRALGDLRRLVIRDGHSGPAPICSPFFLRWLTDPVLNGGGALTDFGCYGANLATWLMRGERPTSVFAVTQQLQPDLYPKVDDEATIVLTYAKAQAIIQASWNWPHGRKDMDLYGTHGAARIPDRNTLVLRVGEAPEAAAAVAPVPAPQSDTFSYLAAIARGEIRSTGLPSVENNLLVSEILDAARESARTGRRIELPTVAPDPTP